jgi:hypothetical protein
MHPTSLPFENTFYLRNLEDLEEQLVNFIKQEEVLQQRRRNSTTKQEFWQLESSLYAFYVGYTKLQLKILQAAIFPLRPSDQAIDQTLNRVLSLKNVMIRPIKLERLKKVQLELDGLIDLVNAKLIRQLSLLSSRRRNFDAALAAC